MIFENYYNLLFATINSKSKFIICIFAEPARFEFQSKNVTIRRGESVTIDCTVIGDNPIEVQWMHNSDRLDMSNHRLSIGQIKTDNGLKSQLSIANSDRQDSGVYRCTADNAYGRSEHLIYLAVQGKVHICITINVNFSTSKYKDALNLVRILQRDRILQLDSK